MSGVYKINGMYTLVFVTYGVILTKTTFKWAPRKENCTCAIFTAYTRLFPLMNVSTRQHGIFGHFAKAVANIFCSFCVTFSRTQIANHILTYIQVQNLWFCIDINPYGFSIYAKAFDMCYHTRYVHFVNEDLYHIEFEQQRKHIDFAKQKYRAAKRHIDNLQKLSTIAPVARGIPDAPVRIIDMVQIRQCLHGRFVNRPYGFSGGYPIL